MGLGEILNWRPRSIPLRFAAWLAGGLALAVLWALASGSIRVLVFGSLVAFEGAAAMMASDEAFPEWKPEKRSGRLLRAYIYRIYWTR